MAKREPIWQKVQHWWLPLSIALGAFGWITQQVVSQAQERTTIAEHEKRLGEEEAKNAEQEKELSQQAVQYQLIQQSLGQISEQLKDLKGSHR